MKPPLDSPDTRLQRGGVITALLTAALLVVVSAEAAEGESATGVVTALSGQAQVKHLAAEATVPVKTKDEVYRGDTLGTAERTVARLLLEKRMRLTIREFSIVTLPGPGNPSTVNLERGSLGMALARGLFRLGEEIRVRTPHAVAALRGTMLIVEVPPAPDTPHYCARNGTECFHVLKGSIEVKMSTDEDAPWFRVNASEGVSVIDGKLGPVRRMSDTVIANLRDLFKEDLDGSD
jgi:hypothetical protein